MYMRTYVGSMLALHGLECCDFAIAILWVFALVCVYVCVYYKYMYVYVYTYYMCMYVYKYMFWLGACALWVGCCNCAIAVLWVFVYVCVFTYIIWKHICLYMCWRVYICYIHARVCVYSFICLFVDLAALRSLKTCDFAIAVVLRFCVCMCTYMYYICMYVYLCTYNMYTFMHMCIYICLALVLRGLRSCDFAIAVLWCVHKRMSTHICIVYIYVCMCIWILYICVYILARRFAMLGLRPCDSAIAVL